MEPISELRSEITSLTSGIKQDAQEIADSLNTEMAGISQEVGETGKAMKDAAEKAMDEARKAAETEPEAATAEEREVPPAPSAGGDTALPDPAAEAARRVAEAEKALQEAREALARAESSAESAKEDIVSESKEE